MSRTMLEVTLRLTSGKTFTGRGRNLPATIERIYNQGAHLKDKRHVTITKHFRTGRIIEGEHRYEGSFQVTMTGAANGLAAGEETGVVEVREAGAKRAQ